MKTQRFWLCIVFFLRLFLVNGQAGDTSGLAQGTMLASLNIGDSLVYYQCRVQEAQVEVLTASGQTLNGTPQKCSVTEKFVLYKKQQGYELIYYTSALTDLPNRKFSGLKIRERPYWGFKKNKEVILNTGGLKLLEVIEKKGREAIEYDFVISKNNTNQIIIKQGKKFKQLVFDKNYSISKSLIK